MHKLKAQRTHAAGCPFEEEEEPAPKAAPIVEGVPVNDGTQVLVKVPSWFEGSLQELHDALREVIQAQIDGAAPLQE